MPLYSRIVYSSQLAPSVPAECVADIVRTARQFNAAHGITGLLVFDGQRFCQYLEGPDAPLQQLIQAIMRDARHTDFTPQLVSTDQAERQFARWAMGYIYIDEGVSLDGFALRQGPAVLERLKALLPQLDMA